MVIAGPTAVGKSTLAMAVAKRVDGEIISCDSAQVYRGLDIGSAKVLPDQRQDIAHHLIDVVDADQRFTVADYQALATEAIQAVHGRGHLPILVGGTGLWLRALVRGYQFAAEQESNPWREHIEAIGAHDGWSAVRRMVRMVDPESYRRIAGADRRRLARALEVWWSTGNNLARTHGQTEFNVSYWVLFRSVGQLHARIAQRTAQMMADGLTAEVGGLLHHGLQRSHQSLSAIGYRETVEWYRGRVADHELEPLIRRHSEQLAKRQMTWFRSEPDAHWIDLDAWGEERALVAIERAARKLREP